MKRTVFIVGSVLGFFVGHTCFSESPEKQAVEVKRMPKPAEKAALSPSKDVFQMEIHTHDIGLPHDVWFIPNNKRLVCMNITFKDAGYKNVSARHPSLSLFWPYLLRLGNGSMWSGRLFNCGANVSTWMGCDHVHCSFWCPAPDWAEAFDLMMSAFVNPKWTRKDFGKARKQLLADTQSASKQFEFCFQNALNSYLYPAPHPYSLPQQKVDEDLINIQRRDVKDALGLLSQQNLILVVSGPREQEAEIIAQLKQQVARLSLQPSKTSATISPVAARRAEQAHTEFDAPQTTIRVMFPPIRVTDPDFFAKTIAFSMLVGPSRYSLLGRELRIKKGLVYSFRAGKYNSQLDPYNFIELHTSQPAEAMKVLAECCEHCKKYGFSRQDFERAQNYMVDSWLGGIRSVEDYTRCVAQIRERGLSLEIAKSIFQKYKDVTYEQVRRVLPLIFKIEGTVSLGRSPGKSFKKGGEL